MAEIKITFIKERLINSEERLIEVKVKNCKFSTENGEQEIETISFEGLPSDRGVIKKKDELETILRKGGNLELSFDEGKVEIKIIEPTSGNFMCASGPAPTGNEPPKIRVYKASNTLNIEWNPDIIKIAASQEQEEKKPDPTPKNPNGPDTPKTPDQNPDPDNPNKGPSNPTPKQPDKSPDKKDTPEPQKTPPKSSEPTSEEVNNAKNKLKQARESNNKDEIINVLNETKDTVEKSSDQELKKEKQLAENELGKLDEKKLREIIKEEVTKELQKFGIKASDLSPENKQKLDELNNNNNNNNNNIKPEEAKNIRTEVLNNAGMQALDRLINELEQEIKRGDEKKIQKAVEKLKQFTEDKSDEYAQNAYTKKKDKVQELLEKANNQSSQNKDNEGFLRLNNPVMWISGIAIIGFIAGAVLIIRSRRKKQQ